MVGLRGGGLALRATVELHKACQADVACKAKVEDTTGLLGFPSQDLLAGPCWLDWSPVWTFRENEPVKQDNKYISRVQCLLRAWASELGKHRKHGPLPQGQVRCCLSQYYLPGCRCVCQKLCI